MSDRRWTPDADPDRPFRIITRTTADFRVPLWEGSFERGAYRHLPIPPADPLSEPDWEILDSSDDKWTTWFRRCEDHVVEARLGGPAVTGLTARVGRRRERTAGARPRRRQYT